MKPFKCFWIYSSLFLFSGCAGFQTKPYSLSKQTDFMSEYCQSGRQKKAYRTTVTYFTPLLEKGLPLDKANQKNKGLSDRKNVLLKQLFYLLADENTKEQVHNQGDEPGWYLLVSKNESDVLSSIKDEDSDTKYRLYTFVVKILNQNKFIIYQSNQVSRRMGYDMGYSTDLNTLMSEYTLLAPKEVMESITETEFDDQNLYSTITLNEKGNVDVSKAIDNRDRLWRAYVTKFTSIKESSADNSRQYNIELDLDLNTFCKYGRKVTDLRSN